MDFASGWTRLDSRTPVVLTPNVIFTNEVVPLFSRHLIRDSDRQTQNKSSMGASFHDEDCPSVDLLLSQPTEKTMFPSLSRRDTCPRMLPGRGARKGCVRTFHRRPKIPEALLPDLSPANHQALITNHFRPSRRLEPSGCTFETWRQASNASSSSPNNSRCRRGNPERSLFSWLGPQLVRSVLRETFFLA